ncbi:DegT/DnrJ/EryC1/StrS family aminotransferase, partial [Candidatus Gottesmanbacteria bacterium]|nr:DegT/DnrJ/EryC1/StrS family aminotransferase [Candidatus Gottesmanbacteria bacterium]
MIPLFTLERQNKILEKELNNAIKEVVDSGIFILGPKVAEFEEKFAKYLGVKYAVGVACGTDALSLALLAVGVGSGDEVILPANAYPTVFAVTAIGAVPKLVDIDPSSYNIDPAKIPQAITKKTKAIIPVHLYGQPSDMGAILKIGNKYGIPVVEDCAQAHGAEVGIQNDLVIPTKRSAWRNLSRMRESNSNKLRDPSTEFTLSSSNVLGMTSGQWEKVGGIGDLACFSFYPTKNLGCFGDGGMVVTNNEDIYKKVRLLRMYGEKTRYNSVLLGRNSRLDELQAAILLVKLKYLDKWNERRRYIASLYKSQISNLKSQNQNSNLKSKNNLQPTTYNLQPPFKAPYAKHVYHLFVIRKKKRDQLKEKKKKKGIQTAIHYPKPIHLQPSFKFLGYKKGDFPEAEKACEE